MIVNSFRASAIWGHPVGAGFLLAFATALARVAGLLNPDLRYDHGENSLRLRTKIRLRCRAVPWADAVVHPMSRLQSRWHTGRQRNHCPHSTAATDPIRRATAAANGRSSTAAHVACWREWITHWWFNARRRAQAGGSTGGRDSSRTACSIWFRWHGQGGRAGRTAWCRPWC